MKTAIKNNFKRFGKKTFYRILGRLIDMAILFGIGYMFGLKLIKY